MCPVETTDYVSALTICSENLQRMVVPPTVSFDIIVLKLGRTLESLSDIAEDDEEQLIGTVSEIRMAFDREFPGITWRTDGALFVSGERFALEVTIPDQIEPTSLHLALRFGAEWPGQGDDEFHARLRSLCNTNLWQAFAVSDSSRIV